MKKSFFLIFTMVLVFGCATAPEVRDESKTITSQSALTAEAKRQQVSTLIAKGDTELTKKNFDAAVSSYQEALRLQPYDQNITRKLDEAKKQREQVLKSAMSIASKAPISSKVVAEQHLKAGIELVKANKVEEGIRTLQKGAELDPNNIRIWFNLGVTFHNLKRFDEAVPYYKKALNINPNDGNVLRHLGIAYIELNKLDEAKTYLESSINVNPQDKDALINLSAIYNIMADSLKNVAQQLIDRASQVP